MKEILELVLKNLVEKPEEVLVKETNKEKSITFEVRVAENDMGKVIGKQGRVAKAIRTIMKSIATKEQKRVSIEFLDN